MPYMAPGDVHVNRELSTIMVSYEEQTNNFIADKVFPNIGVDKQTDFFNKMGRKSFLQTGMQKRAPRTETPGVDWNFSRDTFACEVWGLHHDIEDQFRASADENWQLDRTGTTLITQQALLRREKEWLANFYGTGIWGADFAGVASLTPTAGQFSQFDFAGNSAVKTFRKARRAFHLRTGIKPNTVVFGTDTWDVLMDHVEFLERIKYTQRGVITQDLVSGLLEIDRVFVADAVEATDQTDELVAVTAPTTSYLAGAKGFWLGYANPNPSRENPSAGYTFSWRGYAGASAFGGRVKKFRMEPIACDRIEIEMAYDMKVVAPELGAFYNAAVL